MKYLRMLLSFLFGTAIFAIGIFLIKHINPTLLSFVTIPKELIVLFAISFIPFASSIESRLKMPKNAGIKYNPLVLECSFEKEFSVPKNKMKAIIKDCYNSVLFEDRVLELVYEDEKEIVYHGEARRNEKNLQGKDRRSLNDFDLVINVEETDKGSFVKIKSNSINPFLLSNNKTNEQHIKIIVEYFQNNKLLE